MYIYHLSPSYATGMFYIRKIARIARLPTFLGSLPVFKRKNEIITFKQSIHAIKSLSRKLFRFYSLFTRHIIIN